jgi:hypothetical protein
MRDPFRGLAFRAIEPLRVNWQASYFQFVAAHGEPMEDGGRLLFADGWSRSINSHRGPVWPPPADPVALRAIQTKYWQLRRQEILRQIAELRAVLAGCHELQEAAPSPLVVERLRQGRKGWRWRPARLDPAKFTGRLADLQELLAECDAAERELAGVNDLPMSDPITVQEKEP